MNDKQETILVVTPSLGIGGREKIAINTVRCFENLGYHTILIIFQRRDPEYPFHGELINLDVPPAKGKAGKIIAQIRRSAKLAKIRRKHNVLAVYSLGDASNITNVLSGLRHRSKSIISLHVSGEVRRDIISRFIFRKADRIVCIAQDMYYHLRALYPKAENALVIENGYELVPVEHKKADFSSLRIVTMGRLTEQKGLDRLIKTVSIIQQKIPDVMLTIIGTGKLEKELKELAVEKGIQKAVSFAGFLANPFPVLQENNIYVLTSNSEGFPNALIESLNCGLPTIAADCPTGPREILSETYHPEPVHGINHEKYGILVENSAEGFEDRFAQAVLQLWDNREEMTYYSEIGPQRARDFSTERYQEKLSQLLKDCADDKRR